MPMTPSPNITQMLVAWSNGDKTIQDDLFESIYQDLRVIAKKQIRLLRPGDSMQTTVVISEAYIRLVDQCRGRWQNRSQFYAIAAYMMRRILSNYFRDKKRMKRGGDARKVSLSDVALFSKERSEEFLALDAALDKLMVANPRQAQIVEMRHIVGMSVEEVAAVLGVSNITVTRDWKFARAWLLREMGHGE